MLPNTDLEVLAFKAGGDESKQEWSMCPAQEDAASSSRFPKIYHTAKEDLLISRRNTQLSESVTK